MILYHLTKTDSVDSIEKEGFIASSVHDKIYFAHDIKDIVSVSMYHCRFSADNWSMIVIELDDFVELMPDDDSRTIDSYMTVATHIPTDEFRVIYKMDYYPHIFPKHSGTMVMKNLRDAVYYKLKKKLLDETVIL